MIYKTDADARITKVIYEVTVVLAKYQIETFSCKQSNQNSHNRTHRSTSTGVLPGDGEGKVTRPQGYSYATALATVTVTRVFLCDGIHKQIRDRDVALPLLTFLMTPKTDYHSRQIASLTTEHLPWYR